MLRSLPTGLPCGRDRSNMKKLSHPQEKTILAALIIALIFLAVWFFVYLPERNRLHQLKEQLSAVEHQIRQVQGTADTNKAIEERIKTLQARHQFMESKFPAQEYAALRLLSDFARKVNMDILSIRSEPKEIFLDEAQQKIDVEGRVGQKLPVSVELKCRYQDMLTYLEMLEDFLPAYVTVEGLRIRKNEDESFKLDMTLNLNLYVLSPPTGQAG